MTLRDVSQCLYTDVCRVTCLTADRITAQYPPGDNRRYHHSATVPARHTVNCETQRKSSCKCSDFEDHAQFSESS